MCGSGHDGCLIRWFSWGEAARRKAREEHKPIYMFIGAPSCHWCGLELRESFRDDEVVRLLNEDFVPVKIDREKYPVLDDSAMSVGQIMNGSIGWPINLFLTPDLKPFFVASYMPLSGNPSHPGFLECLPRMKWLWLTENESVVSAADEILESFRKDAVLSNSDVSESTVGAAAKELMSDADEIWGGFGHGVKFPSVHKLLFLAEFGRAVGCSDCSDIIRKSLDGMANGAIRDHLGGGFHRCTSDREWRRPRFEKLLVDQAMTAIAFAEGFDRYRDPSYWRVADETLAYVLLNLYSPGRGFMSSQGADSEGENGAYYLWTSDEIDRVLGESSSLFKRAYGITEDGNFIDDEIGEPNGKNVLYMTGTLRQLASREDDIEDEADLYDLLAKCRQVLASCRRGRVEPERDGKILSDWNGFFIAALARCGRLMDRKNYAAIAERECSRIWRRGELCHVDDVSAVLDDYASTIWAFLETYRVTDNLVWRERAKKLLSRCEDLFGVTGGGYRLSDRNEEGLLFSRSYGRDGTYPSGNAVMAGNLVTLWIYGGELRYRDRAIEVVSSFGEAIERVPGGHSHLLTALLRTMA